MSVKVFHIKGYYKKGKRKIKFGKYVRALSIDDAIEEMQVIMGSKHHVKRNELFIDHKNIKEISNPDEITDPYVHSFTTEADLKIPKKV
ncbi:MAG: 50S ribosomal protein L18Ae [Candidatus Heimdallarchaeaceae archaeon]